MIDDTAPPRVTVRDPMEAGNTAPQETPLTIASIRKILFTI